MLTWPAVCVPEVTELLQGRDYYRPAHETIHDAIVALWARRDPVDMVTVAAELQKHGELQRIGGGTYLHDLAALATTPAAAAHYAHLVVDKALARRIMEAGLRVQQLALEGADMAQVAEDARAAVDAAASTARTVEGGATVGDAIAEAVDWLETPPTGADTPWMDVNEATNGLLDGQLVTVAARPGHGKSVIAKDVGLFTAQQGKGVHIATLEMSRNEYMARILSGLARVPISNMLRRSLSDREWAAIGEAAEKVRGLPLYLDDRPSQSMAQIRAAARQTQRRFGSLGLIAIDYLQLVRPRDPRLPRREQVDEMSRDAKLLAKEFYCPVLLLAQLNRRSADRSDHRPLVTDLRESGAIEQDSDQVWLLHRPDQYGEDERLGEVDLIVGKNRNGPAPTTIPLTFLGHYATVASMV